MNNTSVNNTGKMQSVQVSYMDHNQNTASIGWRSQLYKSLFLATSSIGIGWLVGRLWRRVEPEETRTTLSGRTAVVKHQSKINAASSTMLTGAPLSKSSTEHRLFQRVAIVYRDASGQQASLTTEHSDKARLEQITPPLQSPHFLSCYLGVLLGGAGSLLTANFLPIAFGSSLCAPSVNSESTTIPDDSTFRQQQVLNIAVEGTKTAFTLTMAAAAIYSGGMALPLLGIVAPKMFDSTLGLVSSNGILRSAIKDNLREYQLNSAKDPNFAANPIEFRMNVIPTILKDLSDKRIEGNADLEIPLIKAHLSETHEIISGIIQQNNALTRTLGSIGEKQESLSLSTRKLAGDINSLNKKYESVQTNIGSVIAQLDGDRRSFQTGLEQLELDTKESFERVNTHIGEMRLDVNHIKDLTKHLIKEAMSISTQGFESDKKIMDLEEKMRECEAKGDLEGAMTQAHKLKASIQEEQQKRLEFDQTLAGISSGIQLVSLAAKVSGDPKLAHQVSTIGQSAVTIAHAFGALSGFGTAATSMTTGFAVLGPMGAIAGAAFALFSLFGDEETGLTIDAQIFEAVRELSKNLHQVRKEMHERFDHVETMLVDHHKYVAARFDRLDEFMQKHHQFVAQRFDVLEKNMNLRFDHLMNFTAKFYKETIDQFIKLHAVTVETRDVIYQIKHHLDKFERDVHKNFQRQYLTDHDKSTARALDFHKIRRYPSLNMTEHDQVENFGLLANWAITGVQDPRIAGSIEMEDHESIAKTVRAHGVEFAIQTLATLAHLHLGIHTHSLPNPSLWAKGTELFLEFLWRTPEFVFKPEQRAFFKEIRNTGARFQKFVETLQESPQLYQRLAENYRNAMKELQNVIKNLVINRLKKENAEFSDHHVTNVVKITTPSALGTESQTNTNDIYKFPWTLIPHIAGQIDALKSAHLGPTFTQTPREAQILRELSELWKTNRINFDVNDEPNKRLRICGDHEPCITYVKNYMIPQIRNAKEFQNQITTPSTRMITLSTQAEKTVHAADTLRKSLIDLVGEFESAARLVERINSHIQASSVFRQHVMPRYVFVQQALVVLSQIQPGIRQEEEIEKRLNLDNTPMDDFYAYLLYHQKPQDLSNLKNTLKTELREGSALSRAIEEVGIYHDLLAAYLQLGFQSEFQNDYSFRLRFENLWSSQSIRKCIESWDTAKPEMMPYIQLQDRALPLIIDFITSVVDKATALTLARDEGDISKRPSGHVLVDAAQQKLHLFEALFFDPEASPTPSYADEL